MTLTRNPNDLLLRQLRTRLLVAVSGGYLLHLAGCFLLSPKFGTSLLQLHLWLGGVALLGLGTGLLREEQALRWLWASRLLVVLFLVVSVVLLAQVLQQGLIPSAHFAASVIWVNISLLLVFVWMGVPVGMVTTVVLLLVLTAGTLVLHRSGLGQELPEWTGLLSVGLTGTVGALVMQFIEQNLTLHEQFTGQLAEARKDALTGVLGRAAIEEEMLRTTRHAQKTGTPLSLIVTDIDHFKRVNDAFGHGAGDDVLRSFAKRLRRNVGGTGGLVGRWGGEEFVILLPGVARPDALAMAERLRHEVESSPVAGQEVTASFGVASFRRSGDDTNTLFGRADERLYEAKNSGRNAVRG